MPRYAYDIDEAICCDGEPMGSDEIIKALDERDALLGLRDTLASRDKEQFRKGFWWGFERARCHPDQNNIRAEWENVQQLRRRQAQEPT